MFALEIAFSVWCVCRSHSHLWSETWQTLRPAMYRGRVTLRGGVGGVVLSVLLWYRNKGTWIIRHIFYLHMKWLWSWAHCTQLAKYSEKYSKWVAPNTGGVIKKLVSLKEWLLLAFLCLRHLALWLGLCWTSTMMTPSSSHSCIHTVITLGILSGTNYWK